MISYWEKQPFSRVPVSVQNASAWFLWLEWQLSYIATTLQHFEIFEKNFIAPRCATSIFENKKPAMLFLLVCNMWIYFCIQHGLILKYRLEVLVKWKGPPVLIRGCSSRPIRKQQSLKLDICRIAVLEVMVRKNPLFDDDDVFAVQ